jgi:hypothetical protein
MRSIHSRQDFNKIHFSVDAGVPGTSDSGVSPGVISIERLNKSAIASSVRTFITEAGDTRDVTLRASGPCH